MNANVTLDIDGYTFNTDADGWVFEDWSGWIGGAPMDVPQEERTGHGTSTAPGRRKARLMSVSGWRAGRRSVLAEAIENLEAMLADGRTGIFRADDIDLGERWAKVQLAGSLDVDWTSPTLVEFQIQFIAGDPFKYGSTSTASTSFGLPPVDSGLTFPLFEPDGVLDFGPMLGGSSGTATVVNHGTAPAEPRFTVTGPTPLGGFQIIEPSTGRTLRFLSIVPPGLELVIDARDATALLDGTADRSGDLIVLGGWPTIPDRSTTTFQFKPVAAGDSDGELLTVDCISTYW